jgi:hypothetical protein
MAKNPGAKDSKGRYLDPAAAINAGLMTKKTAGVVSPGKIVAKVVAKVAGKATTKATTKALKAVNKPTDKAAKVSAKVEKKALKAANKPVKSANADLINRNNPQARRAILSEKPANPRVTRGGSAKSKLNWPASMKNNY